MGIIFGIERDRDRRTRESDRLRRLGDAVVTEAEERERQFEIERIRRATEIFLSRREEKPPFPRVRPTPPGIFTDELRPDPFEHLVTTFLRRTEPGGQQLFDIAREPFKAAATERTGAILRPGGGAAGVEAVILPGPEERQELDFLTAIIEGEPTSLTPVFEQLTGQETGSLAKQLGELALEAIKPRSLAPLAEEAGDVLAEPGFQKLTTSAVLLPEDIQAASKKFGPFAPAVALEAEFFTSPAALFAGAAAAPFGGAASLPLSALRTARFFGAGAVGGVATGTGLRQAGFSEEVALGGQVAGNIFAPGGGIVPAAALTRPAQGALKLATSPRVTNLLRRALVEEFGGLPQAKTAVRGELNAQATNTAESAFAEPVTSFPRERATVKVKDLEFRPDLFQARDADPGSAVSAKRVAQLVDAFDEAQFSPPHTVINPETGKPIVYRGHHRTAAYAERFGQEADIEIFRVGADINNPEHLKLLMLEGDSSNFKTALPNFREKVRAVSRAEAVGLQDSEIALRLRMSEGEVLDLKDANRLGSAVLDRVVAESTLGPVASELGRGVRAYGMSPEDAAAWFRRIAEGPKGQRPTTGALRETIDKFGQQFKKVPEEMFAGFETAGGTRGGILAVIDDNAKLRSALKSQVSSVKRTQKAVDKLAKLPGVTAAERKGIKDTIAVARREQARLEQEIAANNKDVVAAFKEAQSVRPADLIASGERRPPELKTSEIVATEGAQAVPSQVSVEAVVPSETTRAITAPSRIDGPANTLRRLGALDETIDASNPILARIETVEQGVQAAQNLRNRILVEFREIGGENFFGVREKVPFGASPTVRADKIARIQEKVNGRQPNQISDYLGARFIGEPADLERIAERLAERYKLVQFYAARGEKTRPDMITLDVDVGEVVAVEVQLITPEWAAIQEQVHEFYAIFRSTTAPAADVEAAAARAAELIANVPAPGSVDVATAKSIVAAVQRGDTAAADGLLTAALSRRTRFEVSGDVLGPEVEQGALAIGAGERPIDTLPLFSGNGDLAPGARIGGLSRANGKPVEGTVLTVGERTVSIRTDAGDVTSVAREGLEVTGAGARAPEPLPIEAPTVRGPTPQDVVERPVGARSLATEPEPTRTGSAVSATPAKQAQLSFDLPDETVTKATSRVREVAAGGGIEPPDRPPPVAGGRGPGGTEPGDIEGWLALWVSRDPSEPAGRSYMRRFLGFRSTEGRDLLNAHRALKKGVPKALQGAEPSPEKEKFILALHGEGDIASLPADQRLLFSRLKARAKAHETRLVNVDPAFERRLLPDYWPRQFKQVGGLSWIARNTEGGFIAGGPATVAARGRVRGPLTPGAIPGFKKGRKYSSLREALDNGEELKTWDVVDQWFLRELEGIEYIYTEIISQAARRESLVIPASITPTGYEQLPYRAFESRPYVDAPTGTIRWSEPLLAEPDFAKYMKRLFGGHLEEGDSATNAMAYIAGTTKRMKVAVSFFQQIDLSFRAMSQANGQAARAIGRGDIPGFFKAYRVVPSIPRAFAELLIPPLRNAARINRLKNPLVRMMSEEGLQLEGGLGIAKRTLNDALTGDEILRFPILGDIPIPEGLAPLRLAQKRLNNVAEFINGGLYDAVHPRIVEAVALSIYDETARVFPKLPQREIARRASEATNIVMSAIPDWQSVMGPRLRQFGRGLFFSVNEFEAWFKVTFKAFSGKDGAAFRTQWLGYMITAFAFAEAINLAFTGQPLGKSQLMPISTDFNGKVQFNSRFMRPKLTGDGPAGKLTNLTGPLGQELYLDILGQADTPFRWMFSPTFALMSRLSAPFSTGVQLIREERFFGKKELDVTTEIGPGITVPSAEALGFSAEQLAAPIGFQALLGEEQSRIGRSGGIIQASGLNVSAERFNELGERAFFEETGRPKFPGAFGSDKATPLTGPEVQKIVRENDRLQTIQDAGDKASRDFGSPFQRVEDAVDNAGLLVELGENIDAAPESLAASAKACLAGNPQACTAARDLKSDFFTSRESVRISERERLEIEDRDPPDVETRDQEILEQYYALERQDFDRNGFIDSQDTRIFLEGRAALAGQLSAGARDALRDPARFFTDPDTIEFQRQFQAASDNVDLYFAIPKYNGLSLADSEELDRLSDEVRFARILEADASGEIPDDDPFWEARLPFLPPTIRAFVEEHFIAKRRGGGVSIIGRSRRRFLTVGTGAPEPEPTLNPEREAFRILHQELFIFFPDIFKVGLGAAATGLLQPETLAASTLAP